MATDDEAIQSVVGQIASAACGDLAMTNVSEVIAHLEQIARLAVSAKDPAEISSALAAARGFIKNVGAPLVGAQTGRAQGPPLQELDDELSVWQTKLLVLFKEPAARQGMAKHAKYWVEKLNKLMSNDKARMTKE